MRTVEVYRDAGDNVGEPVIVSELGDDDSVMIERGRQELYARGGPITNEVVDVIPAYGADLEPGMVVIDPDGRGWLITEVVWAVEAGEITCQITWETADD